MKDLTKAEKRVLNTVKRMTFRYKKPPTIQEITDRLGFASANSVYEHLQSIERKGHIDRTPGDSRSIVIIDGSPCAYCGGGK